MTAEVTREPASGAVASETKTPMAWSMPTVQEAKALRRQFMDERVAALRRLLGDRIREHAAEGYCQVAWRCDQERWGIARRLMAELQAEGWRVTGENDKGEPVALKCCDDEEDLVRLVVHFDEDPHDADDG